MSSFSDHFDQQPVRRYRGVIERAVDGDTLVVLVDCGFDVHKRIAVRVAGVNTPELRRGDPADRAKGEAARAFVDNRCAGWPCVLLTTKDRRSFERYVADVYLYAAPWDHGPDGNWSVSAPDAEADRFALWGLVNLSKLLIATGHGVPA